MLKAIGFDLDNTLYDQWDHISAFAKHASKWLSQRAAVDPVVVERSLLKKWRELTPYHRNLFDEVLKDIAIADRTSVKGLIEEYHHFQTELRPYPNTVPLLERLGTKYQLFVITDGNYEMQKMKVRSLGISKNFSLVIYTGQYGSEWTKPNKVSYIFAAEKLGRRPDECAYVGDNPLCDFQGAMETGFTTIRVRTGPFAFHVPSKDQLPNYSVENVTMIEAALLMNNVPHKSTDSAAD